MADVELILTGGTVVSADGRRRVDVAISDGKVHSLGSTTLTARRTLDVDGMILLPGGVDTHVHLMDPGSTDREDFPSGTRAAAAAGTTTIIEHSHGHPVRTVATLTEKTRYLEGRANVDYGLAAHAWPSEEPEVAALWQAGVSFFKVFTCTTHGVPGHTAADLRRHFRASAAVGANSLVHCEDESLTADAERLLRKEGRLDGGLLPEWRNRDAEVVAAAVTSLLARRSGARITVAHVSHPEVASYLAQERRRGAQLMAETCLHYLLLREHEVLEHGPFRKFTPPARARTDADEAELWTLLRRGDLTHVSSDHAPATREQKLDGDLWDVHFGLPGLDSTMALLVDAASRGILAFEDVARLYSETPSRVYGLWPRKGAIRPGSDADIAIVDPQAAWTLTDDGVLSKAGWTPYHQRRLTGRVVLTLLRGEVIAEAGVPRDTRTGRFVPGPGASSHMHPADR